jgi:ADP-heptose:LPS heptosyltransferase
MMIVQGLIVCLKKTIPDSYITFLHSWWKTDKKALLEIQKKYPGIDFKMHPWFRESKSRLLSIMLSFPFLLFSLIKCAFYDLFRKFNFLQARKYDVIVDLNTDALKDSFVKGKLRLGLDEKFMWKDIQAHIPVQIVSDSYGYGSKEFFNFLRGFNIMAYQERTLPHILWRAVRIIKTEGVGPFILRAAPAFLLSYLVASLPSVYQSRILKILRRVRIL